MKTIPLTQGQFAIVDDEDYELLSGFKWYAQRKGACFYAARRLPRIPGRPRPVIYMHRLVLPDVPQVDHKDGNGLNNQRVNLRAATTAQNQFSFQHKRAGKTSKFRGVSWCPSENRWRALIGVNMKVLYVGQFRNEEDAARAYDAAARKYFGEFASPNFP